VTDRADQNDPSVVELLCDLDRQGIDAWVFEGPLETLQAISALLHAQAVQENTVSTTTWDEYQIQERAPGEAEWRSAPSPHVETPEHGARRIATALAHPEGTGRHAGKTGYTYRIIRRHCTRTEGPWEVIPTPRLKEGSA